MFGTLRYNSTNDSTEFLDCGYGFLADDQSGQPGQHVACDQCRGKKVFFMLSPERSTDRLLDCV